jgi:cold shock CspA family protein
MAGFWAYGMPPWGFVPFGGKGKGFGKGKGYGKGFGYGARRSVPTVPEDAPIDESIRYAGTVNVFNKFKGFGFLDISTKGVVPGDKVFCHWKGLKTQDRFPQLTPGMQVEFNVNKKKARKGFSIRAINVTLPGGGPIRVQDELDASKKTFVGGQHLRYTGELKFYDPLREMGYVKVDDGYDMGGLAVPKELRVERAEVNSGGRNPQKMEKLQVEFGIWQTRKGQFKVYNMTLPGGASLTSAELEHRTVFNQTLTGTVQNWNWRKRWGLIKPTDFNAVPPAVQQKMLELHNELVSKGKVKSDDKLIYFKKEDIAEGQLLADGVEVHFEPYVDDKGAGAQNIRKV